VPNRARHIEWRVKSRRFGQQHFVGGGKINRRGVACELADQTLRPQKVEIDRIASVATGLLADAMRAYTERDAQLASSVIERDDEVDKLYKRSIKLLQQEMQADPELVRSGTRYLFILASLERVGDRAGNIAWHTKGMIGAE